MKTFFTTSRSTRVVWLISCLVLFPALLVSAETVLKFRNESIVTDIVRTTNLKPKPVGPHRGVNASRLPLLLVRSVR